jgi:hypothetical protein
MAYCVNGCWSVLSNVGIGTDDLATYHPAYMSPSLNIVGSRPGINLENSSGTLTTIRLKGTAPQGEMHLNFDGSSCTNGSLSFYTYGCANRQVLRIGLNGNVGIGTDSPLPHNGSGLVVRGNGSDTRGIIELWDGGASGGKSVLQQVGGDTYFGQLAKGTGSGNLFFLTGGSGASATISMTVLCNGRVGIGTASPSTMLQVCGDVSGENAAWVQNTNSAGYGSLRALNNLNCAAVFGVGGSTTGAPYANTGYLYTDPNVNFVFSIGATEKMRITSTGNVGIACTSPGSKLTVGGTLTTTDTIITTSGTVSNYLTYTATTGVIGTQTNHALQIRTNDTERIRVTCTGCIGVNITSPTYTLHVNGTFYAAGSSCEYKTQICQYNTDSCMFMKLTPVTYQYKDEYTHLGKELKSGTQIGLIAEDVAEVYPELAILKDEDDIKIVRNVDYEKLSIVLLSEVQKLRKELDELKTK